LLLAVFALLLVPSHSSAAWHEANGEHFIVYANQSEQNIKRYAEKLERYHAALGNLFEINRKSPSPSNKVSVYVVKSRSLVRKLYGNSASRNVGGFYRGRAGGSVAVIPRIKSKNDGLASFSEKVLLHEYAHHVMFSNTELLIPRWYSEGFAEFYSSAKFEKDGSIELGLPANHRAQEIYYSHNVPIEEIFDTRLYLNNKSRQHDNYYGRSWLLYHYLIFSEQRKGQSEDYIARLQKGEAALEAARSSFGSLHILDKELGKYLTQKMSFLRLPPEKLVIRPVTVRRLDAGESAVIPLIMRSKNRVNLEQAEKLLPKARKIAERFPANAAVLGALSEAEVNAQNYSQAIVAADAALAIDANSMLANIQKGIAMAGLASTIDNPQKQTKAWTEVRRQFIRANLLETENPLPLLHFYWSYIKQGVEPTRNAVDGLELALNLAPFDSGVRWVAAQRQMAEGRYADARDTIVPLALNPHVSDDSEAKTLLREAEKQLAAEASSI